MAKKITAAQDSIPKQTYFSKTGKGNVSNKSGGDYYIERMGKKPIAKKDSTSNSISSKINSAIGGKKKVAPSVKIDSTKKVIPGGGSKPSIIIKKETKISRPTIGGSIPFPVRPEKKAIIMKKMMK